MSTVEVESAPTLLVDGYEAAKILGMSQRWLWANTKPRGTIPCIRLGKSVRYSVDALRDWIAEKLAGAST